MQSVLETATMSSFEAYLPILYPLPQGKLLVFLKEKDLHLVLITHAGDLYRNIMDAKDFKEEVGYALNDNFSRIFLNALKDLRLKLEKEQVAIIVILAKREVTITLKRIYCEQSISMLGLLGVTNKVPDLPVQAPMGPPRPKPKPPKRKRNVIEYKRRKRKRKERKLKL